MNHPIFSKAELPPENNKMKQCNDSIYVHEPYGVIRYYAAYTRTCKHQSNKYPKSRQITVAEAVHRMLQMHVLFSCGKNDKKG